MNDHLDTNRNRPRRSAERRNPNNERGNLTNETAATNLENRDSTQNELDQISSNVGSAAAENPTQALRDLTEIQERLNTVQSNQEETKEKNGVFKYILDLFKMINEAIKEVGIASINQNPQNGSQNGVAPENSSNEPAYTMTHEINPNESIVNQIKPGYLNESQLANARIIEEVFSKAGLGPKIIAAAIVNAVAESSLNSNVVGDNGSSIGLFQINNIHFKKDGVMQPYINFGPGLRMYQDPNHPNGRKNPYLNCQYMIHKEILTSSGNNLRSAAEGGENIDRLAAIFSRDIERPGDEEKGMRKRSQLAREMFG